MKRFSKICLILAAILFVIGLIVGGVGFAMGAMSDLLSYRTPAALTMETLDVDHVKALELNLVSEQVEILPSEDDMIHIEYTVCDEVHYTDTIEQNANTGENTLVFTAEPQKTFGFDFFGFEEYPIQVFLPHSVDLTVYTVSGNMLLSSTNLMGCDLSSTSGDIVLDSVSADRVQCSTTSGNVTLRHVASLAYSTPGDVQLGTVSGEMEIADSRINGSLLVEGTSGDVDVERTTIQGAIDISTVSGEVEMELSDDLAQTMPNVKTVSGEINVDPFKNYGDQNFDISTTSGDVTIRNLSR